VSSTTQERQATWGGSEAAIQFHYDVGNEFYALWLGKSQTYSSAYWVDESDTSSLDEAQLQKIDWHVQRSGAKSAERVLDIGCGWGTVLQRLVTVHGAKDATGLTLSRAQAEHVRSLQLPGVDVRLESWAAHAPERPYDAIISIGAFEHFASPSDPLERRREVYREFFERTARWLKPNGRLSLQTIAYGSLRAEDASEFMKTQIFPDAELPRLSDITETVDGIFEVEIVRNDRRHYAKTCEMWWRNLRDQRAAAIEIVGEETYRRYEQYLKLSSVGFAMGKLALLRISLRRDASGWKSQNGSARV